MAVEWNTLFASLGADPAVWLERDEAGTQRQLQRFLFLHQAWKAVVPADDDTWIDREIAQAALHPDAPYSGIGSALDRLATSGAQRADLVEVARGMQARLLFEIAYLLSDPGFDNETLAKLAAHDVAVPAWALVSCDQKGTPTVNEISCLHESVLGSDPAGREVRSAKP